MYRARAVPFHFPFPVSPRPLDPPYSLSPNPNRSISSAFIRHTGFSLYIHDAETNPFIESTARPRPERYCLVVVSIGGTRGKRKVARVLLARYNLVTAATYSILRRSGLLRFMVRRGLFFPFLLLVIQGGGKRYYRQMTSIISFI